MKGGEGEREGGKKEIMVPRSGARPKLWIAPLLSHTPRGWNVNKSPREGTSGCEPRKQEARSIKVFISPHFIIF